MSTARKRSIRGVENGLTSTATNEAVKGTR
jgi:hypothetical protein